MFINLSRIKILEEEHARHQLICSPGLHTGLYERKRNPPRRNKKRKISSNSGGSITYTIPQEIPTFSSSRVPPVKPVELFYSATHSSINK